MANIVTRFDVFTRNDDDGEREVVRLFEKRKLVGEFDVEDCTRYPDGIDEEDFTAWLATGKDGKPLKAGRTVTQAMDYLGSEPEDEDAEEEEREPGSVVPEKYRERYGAAQNCGDDIAQALTAFVTAERASKKNPDGGLDRAKLRGVAEANGIGDKLAEWEDRGLNGGLLRMNTSNVLRGMNRRGEGVVIGDHTWPEDVTNPKHPNFVKPAKAEKTGNSDKPKRGARKPK